MPTEEQFLEIHRLAVLGGAADIAQDVTGWLADSWLRVSRFREVKDLCTQTLELGHAPATLLYLGRAKRVLGDMDEALRLFLDVLKMYEDAGDRTGLAATLNDIGLVYAGMGQPAKALEYYQQVLPLMEAVGDCAGSAAILTNIGRVYSDTGEPAKALECHQQALPLMEAVGDRAGLATTLTNIGRVSTTRGSRRRR